jgi:predicted transposase YbfD/YdcC
LTFARVVRAHWGVENRLHWVLVRIPAKAATYSNLIAATIPI